MNNARRIAKPADWRGAALDVSDALFKASLEGNVRRAIDIRESEPIKQAGFRRLVRAAVAANAAARAQRAAKRR